MLPFLIRHRSAIRGETVNRDPRIRVRPQKMAAYVKRSLFNMTSSVSSALDHNLTVCSLTCPRSEHERLRARLTPTNNRSRQQPHPATRPDHARPHPQLLHRPNLRRRRWHQTDPTARYEPVADQPYHHHRRGRLRGCPERQLEQTREE